MRLAAKLWSARLSLLAERFLQSYSAALIWISLALIAALAGLSFPFMAVIFWIGAAGCTAYGWRKFQWPDETEIQARLEQDSAVRHRPLRSQTDTLTGTVTKPGHDLWTFEHERKKGLLNLLGWVRPRFHLVRKDPYALRVAMILLLVTLGITSGAAAPDKLRNLLIPFALSVSDDEESAALKVLIMPPAYTQKPYIMITGRLKDPVDVPQGSTVKVMAKSWIGHLTIKIGDETKPLVQEGKTDVYSAERHIAETDMISITQLGFPRLSIPVKFIPDQPPQISLRGEPEVMMGGQLRLPLLIQDDYGLKLVRLRAILSAQLKEMPLGEPVYEEQSVIASSGGKPVEINPRFDLTGHPWAGYPVTLLIEAEDYAGQTAEIEPLEIKLPERTFRHPVAQTIVAIRKLLIRKGEFGANGGMMAIASLLTKPQNFDWDILTTLALRSAAGRLSYERGRTGAEGAIAILWPTALHLEDGNLTTTETDLRKALEALQKAMKEKASPEEISRLMQQFKDALAAHLMAMQKEIEKKMANGEMTPLSPDMMTETLDPNMINDFLSQLENEMINGDINSAMKKLENLQKLADMLNPAMAQGLPEDVKKDMQAMKDVQKIIDQQQALLDKTRSLEGKDAKTQGEKGEQDKIGGNLKDAIPGGQAPAPIQSAGKSMSKSSEELGKNSASGSIPHQQAALNSLREGRKQMQQALQKKMQNMMGISMTPGGQRPYDPLGRGKPDRGRNLFEEKVDIQTGADRKKADEILKIIRERSGDQSRPLSEREYYQRLLRQW